MNSITSVFDIMSLLIWKMQIKRPYPKISCADQIAVMNRTLPHTFKLKDASPIITLITTLTVKTRTSLMLRRWVVFQKTFRDQIKNAQICSTVNRPSSWVPTTVIKSSTRKHLSMGLIKRLGKISKHTLAQRWLQMNRVITDEEAHPCIDRTKIGRTKTCKQLSL